MTADELAALAGVGLSLLFGHVPKFEGWFNAQEKQIKSLVMLGLLLLATVAIFGLSCAGWNLGVVVSCDKAGAEGLARIFLVAWVTNQATFMSAVRPFQKPQP